MQLKTRKTLYLGSALVIMIAGAFWGSRVVWSQTFGLPVVQTNQVTLLSNNLATLSGQVTPNGYQTTYWFEYGMTQTLGSVTPSQSVGSGYNPSMVSFTLSGLSAGTTYYYRIDAQNQSGTTQGQIISFSTTGFSTGGNAGGLSVTTNAVTGITANGATLNAFAGTGSSQSTAWFEYGTDSTFLSQSTPTTIIGTSDFYRQTQTNSFFNYALTNLTPGTTYYFRAVLQNNGVTNYGSTLSFQTYGSSYAYNQQVVYQEPTYQLPTYQLPSYQQPTYQPSSDVSTAPTPQYIYVPKYIYVNADESTPSYNNGYYGNGVVSYSYDNGYYGNGTNAYQYNQQPTYSYPTNYSVSAFMPTQYPYGYAPYAQVTPQGTQYNYNNGQLAASVAGVASSNQVAVLVGFILLVSVIVVLGALAFKR